MKILIVFLFFYQVILAQKSEAAANIGLVDSVQVEGTKDESFMVYFPKKYTQSKSVGVVFIFDPGGNGVDGIMPFVSAAENYNFLLVCSNNSKNGPLNLNNEIAFRLFDFVFKKYNIDKKRLVVAGFSGGARLAGNLALNTGIFNGVVACGASFQLLDIFVPQINDFLYVGLIGKNDMNYQEMIKNVNWLDKKRIKNQIFISDKGHVWPDESEILRAFDWLEIEFQKKGFTEKNNEIVNRIYQKNKIIADAFFEENNLLLALHEYERLDAEFGSINSKDDFTEKINEIKKSKDFSKMKKVMNEVEIFEENLIKECEIKFYQDLNNLKVKNDLKFWINLNKELNEKENKINQDIQILQMTNRISSALEVMISVAAQDFKNNGQQQKYDFCRSLLKILKD
ncbi:hypothetical protein [Flavobacterium sp. H122]|uniref:hypothetical protein n=1 Tax=Flavobacterium sp. H122 TaxID=2529860 RepID=UPI0010AB0063|nr:hypothetical protein [Flavobacterium sp. H122]